MEWWKLFSGTFVLIFLAELGDKTQLAAMAKTADSPGDSSAKWVVFLGASTALVASTFIAVFLGHLLKTLVPDERYIKIAAGGLFLVFGLMILYETFASFRGEREAAPAPAATAVPAPAGLVGELALSAAMDFESLTGERYRRLARKASPGLAALLDSLAREEDSHLARLRGLPDSIETGPVETGAPAMAFSGRNVARADNPEILAELIRHEEATAEFYRALSRRALIPSLKAIFGNLAGEEEGHARRLAEMSRKEKDGLATESRA